MDLKTGKDSHMQPTKFSPWDLLQKHADRDSLYLSSDPIEPEIAAYEVIIPTPSKLTGRKGSSQSKFYMRCNARTNTPMNGQSHVTPLSIAMWSLKMGIRRRNAKRLLSANQGWHINTSDRWRRNREDVDTLHSSWRPDEAKIVHYGPKRTAAQTPSQTVRGL